jgi:starch-binding outer membrane protein, SusD/RagB family
LIEAEAFLAAGDIANYLATLNALRAAPPKIGAIQPAPMPPLTDPGTATARQAQLFSEKAYWTFGRGQRLSDMRRLERQYAWPDSAVFPTGTHYRGIAYGTDVNLPVPQDELNNNPLAGNGCTDRKP